MRNAGACRPDLGFCWRVEQSPSRTKNKPATASATAVAWFNLNRRINGDYLRSAFRSLSLASLRSLLLVGAVIATLLSGIRLRLFRLTDAATGGFVFRLID